MVDYATFAKLHLEAKVFSIANSVVSMFDSRPEIIHGPEKISSEDILRLPLVATTKISKIAWSADK